MITRNKKIILKYDNRYLVKNVPETTIIEQLSIGIKIIHEIDHFIMKNNKSIEKEV